MRNVKAEKKVANRCAIVVSDEPGQLLERVAAQLEARGLRAELLKCPLPDPITAYDLVVLRDRTPPALAWAKCQQQRGSFIAPDPARIELVKDRWTCRRMMTSAGAKLPDAVMGTPPTLIAFGIERLLPLVLKNRRVHGCQLKTIYTNDELNDELKYHGSRAELVAERYIAGQHYTAAFIEERIFVFRRPPFAFGITDADPVQCPSPEMVEIVECYRSASGLDFGKIDVVEAPSGDLLIVDCGVSPNLWLVADADRLISAYLLRHVNKRRGKSKSVRRTVVAAD